MNDVDTLSALRSELRGWLADNSPANWRAAYSSMSHQEFAQAQRDWFLKLVNGGYAIPHWPAEWPGGGRSLAAQKVISFDYDSTLEVVSNDNQTVGLASSGKMTLNRPDKIHGTRTGGFADIEFAFDGKTLTFLGKHANAYAQVDAPGTIDQLVDTLRDKYHRPVPGADLNRAGFPGGRFG